MFIKRLFIIFSIVGSIYAIDTKKIDTFLKCQKNFSGSLLIAKKDKIIFNQSYGYASYEFDILNTSQVKFPIASNTKLFTAVAIMQLQEKKLLKCCDTIKKYVPNYPDGNKITIHHLLTHTSGIKNYYKQWQSIRDSRNLQEMIDIITSWSLEFEPGTQYAYSNSGYTMLAYIIEKVSGLSYQNYIYQHIFQPLGMSNSGSITNDNVQKNRATGYVLKNDIVCNASAIYNPILLIGNGDIYSTVEDMHKWIQGLLNWVTISKGSWNSICTPHFHTSGKRAHGYGCFIDHREDKSIIEYTGGLVGFLSWVVYYKDDEITMILLTNLEDFNQFDQITNRLSKYE